MSLADYAQRTRVPSWSTTATTPSKTLARSRWSPAARTVAHRSSGQRRVLRRPGHRRPERPEHPVRLRGTPRPRGAHHRSDRRPGQRPGLGKQAYDDDVYLSSNQTFVNGPATPPAGKGSLRFKLDSDTNPRRVELFRTAQYDGTLLRDLRTVKFSTFQRADAGNATPQQPVYLRLSVSDDGTDVDTLYYFPANNGGVAQSTWQTWDASRRPASGASAATPASPAPRPCRAT